MCNKYKYINIILNACVLFCLLVWYLTESSKKLIRKGFASAYKCEKPLNYTHICRQTPFI